MYSFKMRIKLSELKQTRLPHRPFLPSTETKSKVSAEIDCSQKFLSSLKSHFLHPLTSLLFVIMSGCSVLSNTPKSLPLTECLADDLFLMNALCRGCLLFPVKFRKSHFSLYQHGVLTNLSEVLCPSYTFMFLINT